MIKIKKDRGEGAKPKPRKRRGLAGGGSLAAMGSQMALPENREAALAIEPEIGGLLAWFTADTAVDRSVPGKLWDGAPWDRPVLSSGTREFTLIAKGEVGGGKGKGEATP